LLQAIVLSNGTATMPVVGLNDIGSDTDLVDHEDAKIWNQQGLVVAVIKLSRPKPLTGIGSNYNPIKTCILVFADHGLGLEPQLFEVAKTNRVTICGARFQDLHDVETRPSTRSMQLHRTGNSIAKVDGEYQFIEAVEHEPKIVPLFTKKEDALSAAKDIERQYKQDQVPRPKTVIEVLQSNAKGEPSLSQTMPRTDGCSATMADTRILRNN